MTVSKLTTKEIPAVAALDRQLFSKESWSEAAFAASLADPSRTFWVAMEGETLLGFCGLSQSFEQGDILNIGVCPAQRGKGIGSLLLQEAINAFKEQGGKELFLEVRASNAAANCHGNKNLLSRPPRRSMKSLDFKESECERIIISNPQKMV